MSLPEAFLERLERILSPDSLAATLRAMSSEAPTVFRVNRLKTDAECLARELVESGFEPVALGYPPESFSVSPEQRRALTEHAA